MVFFVEPRRRICPVIDRSRFDLFSKPLRVNGVWYFLVVCALSRGFDV